MMSPPQVASKQKICTQRIFSLNEFPPSTSRRNHHHHHRSPVSSIIRTSSILPSASLCVVLCLAGWLRVSIRQYTYITNTTIHKTRRRIIIIIITLHIITSSATTTQILLGERASSFSTLSTNCWHTHLVRRLPSTVDNWLIELGVRETKMEFS